MTAEAEWKPRELTILALMAEGLSNGEIGARLHLSADTVRWYNKRIFARLGVSRRQQAAQRAAALGLLASPARPAPAASQPRAARPAVRYAANGKVHLAYQVIGEGPVDLVFIHGFLSHLELAWENEEFTRFFERLGRRLRVVLFDKRGMGLSDRIQGAPTLEETIEDAGCVMAAAGSQRAYVLGTSEGGAAAVLLAARYPERVRGLILYAAMPKLVQTAGEPAWAAPAERFEQMIDRMQQAWGGPWAVENFAPTRAGDEGFRAWWAKILRAASSPSSVRAVLEVAREVDIRALLPQVRTRTLVAHKTHDLIAPPAAGRYFAEHLPNATWLELPGGDHIYFVEGEALGEAILDFCLTPATEPQDSSWIGIVLRVLPADGQRLAPGLQDALSRCGARRVAAASPGAVAVFEGPTPAIQCAQQLRRAGMRISLHVGECGRARGQPLPSVLAAATRAAEAAEPGQVVVTRTLRDILAGSAVSLTEQPRTPASEGAEGLRLFALT